MRAWRVRLTGQTPSDSTIRFGCEPISGAPASRQTVHRCAAVENMSGDVEQEYFADEGVVRRGAGHRPGAEPGEPPRNR